MRKTDNMLRTGDCVEVCTPEEIAQTLNAEGALDGLPFMPEMLEYCGRRFRVSRRVEKTCVEISAGAYDFREFPQSDVVLLDGLRCQGTEHGGCQRACMVFWKTAWLRKVYGDQPVCALEATGAERLRGELKTMSAPGRYFCQSTELARATRSLPRFRRLLKCYYDVRSGGVGLLEMLRLILVPLRRKITKKIRPRLVGSLNRTPVGDLELQAGDLVEVQALPQMVKTLDRKGRNRGLVCDYLFGRFSGKKYRVQGRLDRMISEPTGEMRKVEATVILEDLTCFCIDAVGGCPRQEPIYWREVWLKRVQGNCRTGV